MRILKIICILLSLLSIAGVIHGAYMIHSAPAASAKMKHSVRATIESVALVVFWACAMYGIQKRTLITWKIGWAVIVGQLLALPVWALSVTSTVPKTDHPGVAAASVIVGGAAVAAYWSLWWNKQKGYFVKPTSVSNQQR
jgi:hypothetical protein